MTLREYVLINRLRLVAALLLSLFVCLFSTAQPAFPADAPPLREISRTELKKELSSLNIAFEASDEKLASVLNQTLGSSLYKGSAKSGGLTVDITRNGNLTVKAADNFLFFNVPANISLNYAGYGTLPVSSTLKFKLRARITPEWKLDAEIYYLGLSDLFSEELGVGPVSIKPRSIIDGLTQPLQKAMSEMINRKINEKYSLKTEVEKIWNAAQKPVLLDKNYGAWLKLAPVEVSMYPLYAANGRVKLSLGLKSYAEMLIGPEPAAQPAVALPPLKQASGLDKSFRAALNMDVYYKDLVSAATPMLIGKDLGSEGKNIVLKHLDVYGSGEKLAVEIESEGSYDGFFYLTCRPSFDTQTGVFSIEDVEFDMHTQSLLMRTADWLLHGKIRDTIREKLNMNLSDRLKKLHETAGKAMERVKLAEHVYLKGNIKELKLHDVLVGKDKISIRVYAEGETAAELN